MKKLFKYIMLTFGLAILLLLATYLLAPDLVKNTAVSLLYPTVTIEEKYKDKFSTEVPPVYELMYIACSLTETFQNDKNLISSRTPDYYAQVKKHFDEHSDHPLVKALEDKLKPAPYSQLQPAMRMFALNYDLNRDNRLSENEIFHVNPILLELFKSNIFYYPDYMLLIEDFAQKTDFYQFYNQNTPYYESLKLKYEKLCDLKGMWNWVEGRFPDRYNSYRIIFSPLTGGFHNTIPGLIDPETDLKQTWMFVSPPPLTLLDSLSEQELQILSSKVEREVFTEIDHNYVNPISDKYQAEIEASMPDYKQWNGREHGYSSSMSTFNEYMTWGVFSLYARDTYPPEQVDSIISIQENFMIGKRQFVAFKEFNQELRRLYEDQKSQTGSIEIESLYPLLLQWMNGRSFDKKQTGKR